MSTETDSKPATRGTHTPGPWEWFPPTADADRFGKAIGGFIRGGHRLPNPDKPDGLNEMPPAVCYVNFAEHRPESETAANARLLSAAPELLEACRKAVSCASLPDAVRELCMDAIRKARGL